MRKAKHYLDEDFPELIEYFVDVNQFHQPSLSKKEVEVICPCCKRKHNLIARTIYYRGNTYCTMCCDNYSFPERFMAAILNQLNIKYKYQFTDTWSKQYRYDFQINIGNDRYIIELDGGLGHGNGKNLDDKTPEESGEIDKIKDSLAIQNGYKIIRIDCNYNNTNRYEFIKNNIINSQFNDVVNINNINWDKCFSDACSSRYHKILELYNNDIKFLDDIAEIVGLSTGSVKQFLLNMMHSGVIPQESIHKENPYKKFPIPMIANEKYMGSTYTPVFCYEDGLLFRTTQDADDYYNFPRFSVKNSLWSRNGYCKGKHFEKYEKLPKDFDYKPKFFSDDQYKEHAYCRWSLDGHLEDIYIHKNNLPDEYKYLAVQRVINGTFETAYGFKWSILPKKLEYQFIKEMDVIERPFLLEKFQKILKGEEQWL